MSSSPDSKPVKRISKRRRTTLKLRNDRDDVQDFDDQHVVNLCDDDDDNDDGPGDSKRTSRNEPQVLRHVRASAVTNAKTNKGVSGTVRPGIQLACREEWSISHAPTDAGSLIMSKVTVNKLRKWFTRALSNASRDHPRLLVLSGPPGSGKSSAVHVIASELGISLAEWHAPLPAHGSSTVHALLDSVQEFVIGIRYPSLLGSETKEGSFPRDSSRISPKRALLLDDIPLIFQSHLSSSAASNRLNSILLSAAESAVYPTVVIFSDSKKSRARLAGALHVLGESPFVECINVPAATNASMSRATKEVAIAENLDIRPGYLLSLVDASKGDIRTCLNSLRVCALVSRDAGQSCGTLLDTVANSRKGSRRGDSQRSNKRHPSSRPRPLAVDYIPGIGVDSTLDTFHAVSKVLNNKRLSSGRSKYVPEDVLSESRADPLAFVSFLHQNYVDFFSNHSDVAVVLDLLSESESMLQWRQDDMLRALLGECGASVVIRGFLHHNTDPVRTGWRPVRGPDHFRVRQASDDRIWKVRKHFEEKAVSDLFSRRAIGTEWLPHLSREPFLKARQEFSDAEAAKSGFNYDSLMDVRHGPEKLCDNVEKSMLDEEGRQVLGRKFYKNGRIAPGDFASQSKAYMPGSPTEQHKELAEDEIVDWD